jgi:hypothetical protein
MDTRDEATGDGSIAIKPAPAADSVDPLSLEMARGFSFIRSIHTLARSEKYNAELSKMYGDRFDKIDDLLTKSISQVLMTLWCQWNNEPDDEVTTWIVPWSHEIKGYGKCSAVFAITEVDCEKYLWFYNWHSTSSFADVQVDSFHLADDIKRSANVITYQDEREPYWPYSWVPSCIRTSLVANMGFIYCPTGTICPPTFEWYLSPSSLQERLLPHATTSPSEKPRLCFVLSPPFVTSYLIDSVLESL